MESTRSGTRIYHFLLVACAITLLSSYFLRHTFSALLTSLALAYLFNPPLKYLEKKGFSRALSITFIYGILAVIIMIASFFLIPYVGHQLDALTSSLPQYVQNLKGALDTWKQELLPYYGAEDLGWIMAKTQESMNRLVAEVSGKGYERIKGMLFALFDLILAPILVFFMLYYKEEFKGILMKCSPPSIRDNLRELGWRINRTLEQFILAMILDCTIVGILCSAALALMGIEFPILNGMFAGFATIVPFAGALISVIPPAFIGYAKSGDLMIIPQVCAVYFLINVIVEGNLIKPLVMRGTLRLNPLAVIFSVMAMGEFMGFWGIVLAVPFAAGVKICAGEIRDVLARKDENATGDL